MPNYRGHLLGGLIAYVYVMLTIITIKPSFITACEWLFFTLAGSLFPDIDTKSKGQKYFYSILLLLFICLLYQNKFQLLSCISCIAITPMLSNHRGLFHKKWFVIVMPIVVWIIFTTIFPDLMRPLLINVLFFIVGALSHLFLDHRKKMRY